MKYIKKFKTHSDYEDYLESQDYLTPNVSYCVDMNEVHFEKYVPAPETRIVATFNVTDTTNPTNIVGHNPKGGDPLTLLQEIEIDGVVQNNIARNYQFDTTGEHTIKYTLVDTTNMGIFLFYQLVCLSTVIIPINITHIGQNTFNGCTALNSVTCNNTIPPEMTGVNVLTNTNDCPIYVPSASVSAYQSASGWSTYASRIQAIPA